MNKSHASDTSSALTQNLWERYGFKGNPFDTRALSTAAQSILPITKAFVGRDMSSRESMLLTNVLKSPGGARAVVEGEIGVGKTTFVNYHRYIWEHEAKTRLFTPVQEIAVSPQWNVREFLLNVLAALVNKALLLWGQKQVEKTPVLHDIQILTRVNVDQSLQFQGSVFGFGGGVGLTRQVTVPQLPETQLADYMVRVVDELKRRGYAGVFIQINNLELLSQRDPGRTRDLFDELRDVLQIPDVYYIFIGHTNLFSDIISPLERVRSIFYGTPIVLGPLTKLQVLGAINKRYELLSVDPGSFIKPVSDKLVEYLYDLYEGKIRFVMDAVNTVITNLPDTVIGTLDEERAKMLLSVLAYERVNKQLTAAEWRVLREAVGHDTFSNSVIAAAVGMKAPNVTQCFNSLLKKRFIYVHRRDGKRLYYKVSEDVRTIRELPVDLKGLR